MNNQPATKEEWYSYIQDHEKSGISRAKYCKQKGLILGRFAYYCQQYSKQHKMTSSENSPSFSPIVINQPMNLSSNEIKIELPNGFRCQVPSSIAPEMLKKLLGALLSC